MNDLAFSFPVAVQTMPKKGRFERYKAAPETCSQIATDYDLIEILSFEAEAKVSWWKAKGVEVCGLVTASVIQPCALTGEPLAVLVEEDLHAYFVPSGSRLAKPRYDSEGEIIMNYEGDDAPEEYDGVTLDLAAVWLEHFTLGLDPFARKEGAELANAANDSDEDASPFAALKALKPN